ncbi:MAG TPA: hypothetical protein VHE34_02815 [Puia sp.]|jgi:hypothetical protein|uniref:hypothetical protein n=1 Tax=Puia sp. TaxID=2045100 RepID=UPI002D165A4B|nr:hypothetical protein [Puia sp.]HVU94121.1 hypothetical protein [Puia sp.]
MQLQTIEFLKQFREEDPGLPREERQYRNVCFRHFGTDRKEKMWLERILENRITQSGLIAGMVVKMEREDRVISRRLGNLMKKMQRVLAATRRGEAYPARFAARLSAEISRFHQRATLYQNKIQLPLLRTLKTGLGITRQDAGTLLGSGDIRYIRDAVLQYLDDIYYYHDVFSRLLEEEYGRTGASAVTTPAEEGLLKLTTLIKSQIFAIEATVNYLNKWGKGICKVEVQGICN